MVIRGGRGARASRRVAVASIATLMVLAAGNVPLAAGSEHRRGGDRPSWSDALRWWFSRSDSAPSWWTPAHEGPPATQEPPVTRSEPPKPPPTTPGPKTPPVTTPESPKPPPTTTPAPVTPPVTDVAPVVVPPAPPAPVPATPPTAVPTASLAPRMVVRKVGPARIRAGATARFRVTVANGGAGAARDVIVADILPAGFSVVRAGSPRVRLSAGRPGWRIARLEPGASRTFVITVRASSQMRGGASCNRVRATAPGAAPVTGQACFTVTALPPRRRTPAVTG